MRALITVVAIVVAIVALVVFVQNEPASDPGVTAATSEDPATPTATIGLIDDARINNADSEPGNWLAYGRTYEEQRFSPLHKSIEKPWANLGSPGHAT